MGRLTKQLNRIIWKDEKTFVKFPHGATQGLIGEAFAEHIPADSIRDGTVFDINVLVSGSHELTEIHLKMRIDSGLCVQMMEWPGNAKS